MTFTDVEQVGTKMLDAYQNGANFKLEAISFCLDQSQHKRFQFFTSTSTVLNRTRTQLHSCSSLTDAFVVKSLKSLRSALNTNNMSQRGKTFQNSYRRCDAPQQYLSGTQKYYNDGCKSRLMVLTSAEKLSKAIAVNPI